MVTYEILLNKKHALTSEWESLVSILSDYNGRLHSFWIIIEIEERKVHYFLRSKIDMPVVLTNIEGFYFKRREDVSIPRHLFNRIFVHDLKSDAIDLSNTFKIKGRGSIRMIVIKFFKTFDDNIFSSVSACTSSGRRYKALYADVYRILSIDFSSNYYTYQNLPKHFNLTRALPLLKKDKATAMLKVNMFPFKDELGYLNVTSYDFDKHSLLLGASGSGKSKFICMLVESIAKDSNLKDKYKFVIVDPHAALEDDIGGLGKVVDFKSNTNSIDLFKNEVGDLVQYTEFMLELFKSEMKDVYNSKLERVLRHAIYLLAANENFNFNNVRKLLTDLEYRNDLIRSTSAKVPYSVTNFFLTDYNELKTTSYGTSIGPIISFLDEMEMLPAFSEFKSSDSLASLIDKNFLTIFSLDNRTLGVSGLKTISGLIFESMFALAQNRKNKEKLIFIIDEVPVVEKPILARFLSEARKYNLSLILAGQYFNQVTDSLKNAIFANVENYYIFKVSRSDAVNLVEQLGIKLEGDANKENSITFLANQPARSLIARATKDGKFIPPFAASTLDFIPIPRIKEEYDDIEKYIPPKSITKIKDFDIGAVDLIRLMSENSTRRKEVVDND